MRVSINGGTPIAGWGWKFRVGDPNIDDLGISGNSSRNFLASNQLGMRPAGFWQ